MFRILIAEDEEPIANLIRMNLTKAGYLCTWAPDGKSAADLMEREKYDLALLDIMLPGINGYELMDYAKACELPVIFLTALGSTEHKVKGLRMGADDYLPKPFEIVALLADKDATKAAADELIQEVPGYITAVENERATKPTVEIKMATLPMIQDKATAGALKKYNGEDYNVTVTVTLTDGKITNVSATSTAVDDDVEYFSSLTDESFFNKFKNILSTDTASIDTIDAVSGATYSSATVKQAVKNALSK